MPYTNSQTQASHLLRFGEGRWVYKSYLLTGIEHLFHINHMSAAQWRNTKLTSCLYLEFMFLIDKSGGFRDLKLWGHYTLDFRGHVDIRLLKLC